MDNRQSAILLASCRMNQSAETGVARERLEVLVAARVKAVLRTQGESSFKIGKGNVRVSPKRAIRPERIGCDPGWASICPPWQDAQWRARGHGHLDKQRPRRSTRPLTWEPQRDGQSFGGKGADAPVLFPPHRGRQYLPIFQRLPPLCGIPASETPEPPLQNSGRQSGREHRRAAAAEWAAHYLSALSRH